MQVPRKSEKKACYWRLSPLGLHYLGFCPHRPAFSQSPPPPPRGSSSQRGPFCSRNSLGFSFIFPLMPGQVEKIQFFLFSTVGNGGNISVFSHKSHLVVRIRKRLRILIAFGSPAYCLRVAPSVPEAAAQTPAPSLPAG